MRLGNAKIPPLPVCIVRVSLVPRLVSFAVAPETVAPLESTTVPVTVPNVTFAFSGRHIVAIAARQTARISSLLKGRRCLGTMLVWRPDDIVWASNSQPD